MPVLPEPHRELWLKLLSCEDKTNPINGLSSIFSFSVEDRWTLNIELLSLWIYTLPDTGAGWSAEGQIFYPLQRLNLYFMPAAPLWSYREASEWRFHIFSVATDMYRGRDVLTLLFSLAERMSWLAAAATQEDKCRNNAGVLLLSWGFSPALTGASNTWNFCERVQTLSWKLAPGLDSTCFYYI